MQQDTGPYAPGALELVRRFVNTLDLETGTDHLADARSWQAWSAEHDCAGRVTTADLTRLRELREVLREALAANHDRQPLPPAAQKALAEAMQWSGARTLLTGDGLRLEPAGTGPRRLVGAVVGAVATAVADGSWSRLKVCRADTCHWAFYDHSRSRTGQWCSMGVCGNRTKQARLRERRGGATA